MNDDDTDRGLQWSVYETTIRLLLDNDALTDAGLRFVRGELLPEGGAWSPESLPLGRVRERHVDLLASVDTALAAGDVVLLDQYRMTDGLPALTDADESDHGIDTQTGIDG